MIGRNEAFSKYLDVEEHLHEVATLVEYRKRLRELLRDLRRRGMPEADAEWVKFLIKKNDFTTARIELDPRRWWPRREITS